MRHNVFCEIGRPRTHASKGIFDTGPGYVLTGDGEADLLATRHPPIFGNLKSWHESAIGLAQIIQQTVNSDGRRGRYMFSVIFIQDPFGGEGECDAISAIPCGDGRMWDDPEPPPPAPEDCCRATR